MALIQNPLNKLKIKLGKDTKDTSKDDILSVYLDDAKYYILNYTNLSEIPMLLNNVMIDLAVLKYSKNGNEGMKSYSEGGISISYDNDVPSELKAQMNKFRKLPR